MAIFTVGVIVILGNDAFSLHGFEKPAARLSVWTLRKKFGAKQRCLPPLPSGTGPDMRPQCAAMPGNSRASIHEPVGADLSPSDPISSSSEQVGRALTQLRLPWVSHFQVLQQVAFYLEEGLGSGD